MPNDKEDRYNYEVFILQQRIRLLKLAIKEAQEGKQLRDWSIELSRKIILADALVTDDLILKQFLSKQKLH